MKKPINQLIGAAAAIFALTNSALALEPARQAYQAEYELNSAGLKSIHKLAFDGKGHGRSEMISADGRQSISIIDYSKRQMQILVPMMKTVMTIPLKDEDLINMGSISEKMIASSRPLGVKAIDGHPCTGTFYKLEGGTEEELWTGNDIGGVRVYSKVITPGVGVSESHLKKFIPNAPTQAAFSIPAGYANQ